MEEIWVILPLVNSSVIRASSELADLIKRVSCCEVREEVGVWMVVCMARRVGRWFLPLPVLLLLLPCKYQLPS